MTLKSVNKFKNHFWPNCALSQTVTQVLKHSVSKTVILLNSQLSESKVCARNKSSLFCDFFLKIKIKLI